MLNAVTSALGTVIGWVGAVVSAVVTGGDTPGALNALLPLLAVGVAVSALLLGVKAIRSFAWGA